MRFALLFALSVLFVMCASTKTYTLDELPDEQLLFSSGGGFTGEWNDYLLLPNGQLFTRRRVIRELPMRELEGLDPKVTKDLFDTFEKQKFAELGYNEPGNMTYVIEHVAAGDTAKVVWGGGNLKPTEELRTYWRRLMGEVRDKEPKPVAE